MRTLVIPKHVYGEIRAIVRETQSGYETGVTLFGVCLTQTLARTSYGKNWWPTLYGLRHVVLAVTGPGPRATHEPAFYSPDTDYTSGVFQALRSALPSIELLGELHVHPKGMTWLSGTDKQTVRAVLTNTEADTVRPREFIAGVMQRTGNGLDIHPYYFSRHFMEGRKIPIEYVPGDAEIVQHTRESAAKTRHLQEARNESEAKTQAEEGSMSQGFLAKVVGLLRRKNQ